MAEEKNSPYKWLPLLGAAVSVGSSIFSGIKAAKAQRAAEAKEKESRAEMNRLRNVYANLDTSNPFMNMENTMEDLTVNQQQAQFQKDQFQQSQANILEGLRGAAGGGGVAALAQQMAQSGQLQAQQASADIGRQEAANQQARAQMAGQLQEYEREGELISRGQEKEKQSTLLGMAQQEHAAHADQVAAAKQAKMDAITGGIKGVAGMIPGFGDAFAQGVGNTSIEDGTGEQSDLTAAQGV